MENRFILLHRSSILSPSKRPEKEADEINFGRFLCFYCREIENVDAKYVE